MSFVPIVAPLAAVLTWLLVATVRWASHRWRLYDLPNERSSHVTPTPRLGGVAVTAVLAGCFLLSDTATARPSVPHAWMLLAATGMLVGLVSLIDDLRGLPSALRLVVHLCAGLVAALAVGPVQSLPVAGVDVPVGAAVASGVLIIWVAGFINAFNFMDGIDGIAASQAAVAAVGWIALGLAGDAPALTRAGWTVLGVTLGFLIHNWAPASIFMGDAGSAVLGFLLAAAPSLLGGPAYLWPGMLLVWPFVFDTTLTLVRRALRRERIWQAHRTHLYQRLTGPGAGHAPVALTYAALAALGIPAALAALQPGSGWHLHLLTAIGVAAVGLAWFVARRERRPIVVVPSSS